MNNEVGGSQNPEPGWVFHPETGKVEKNTPATVVSNPEPVTTPPPVVETTPPPQAKTQNPEPAQPSEQTTTSSPSSVSWTASEFIDHTKNFGWYAFLLLVTLLLGATVYLITKDVFSVAVIVFFACVFGIVAGRKPKVLTYSVNESGINIGEKGYPYSLFKSFSVMEEIAIDSIVLSPLKRFMPPITIYFAPEDKDKIIDVLAHYLPHEEKNHDNIEKLMQRIRF